MEAGIGHRRSARVRYPTSVKLARDDGEWIESRSFDLSEGGIGVMAFEGWPVGSRVRCRFELDGGVVALRGAVAWCSPEQSRREDTPTLVKLGEPRASSGPQPRAMGIRFEPPSGADGARLRNVVRKGQPLCSPVELRFEGEEEPLRARAEATADGLRLRASLPPFRMGAALQARFPSVDEPVRAVVRDVRVVHEDDLPELRVDLSTAEATGLVTLPPGARAGEAADSDAEARAAERARGWELGLVSGLIGVAVGVALTLGLVWAVDGGEAKASASSGAATEAAAESVTVTDMVSKAATATAKGTVADTEPGSDVEPGSDTEPATATVTATVAATDSSTETDTATGSVLDSHAVAARASDERGPAVWVSEDLTRVALPIEGDAASMHSYLLSSPGVVVELPNARTPLLLDNYGVHEGLVKRVWVRETPEGALQVRVIFVRAAVRHEVKVEDGALVIDVRP
jgi:hypothetical protein